MDSSSSGNSDKKSKHSASIFAKKRNNSYQLNSLLERATQPDDNDNDDMLSESAPNDPLNKQHQSISSKIKKLKLNPIASEPTLSSLHHLTPTINTSNGNHHHHHHNKSPSRTANNANVRVYRSSIEYYRLKLSRSKLKAVTRTSALLSGFAMVAMVELTLNYNDYFEDINKMEMLKALKANEVRQTSAVVATNVTFVGNATNVTNVAAAQIDFNNNNAEALLSNGIGKYVVPEYILILYSFVTCLLVGVNMLALMISTCILPHVEASSYENIEFEQQLQHSFMSQSQLFNPSPHHNTNGQQQQTTTTSTSHANDTNFLTTPKLNQTVVASGGGGGGTIGDYHQVRFPHRDFHRFIELAWISSTVVGIFLFLVEIALVCYIKFYPISVIAGMTGAIVMSPILVIFVVFTFTFYKRLASFKLTITEQFLKQV